MERIGYKVVLNFANLYGVEIEKREINGIMEDVMVVPLRMNGFYVSKKPGKKGVYLYGRAMPSDINPYNQSHYLVSAPNKSVQRELVKLGYKPLVYFGNLSFLFATEGKSRPASQSHKLDDVLDQVY
mgnify:FL=1